MMKNLISLTLLTFLVAFLSPSTQHPLSAQANSLITTTCKKTSFYQLCVSTLTSDSRSKSSDLSTLGLIVVDAIKAKSTSTLTQINKLMNSTPQLRGPLRRCVDFYKGVLGVIPTAVEALTKGDPKFAESSMVDAANEAESCEKSFGKSKSPLSDMNKVVHDLSVVATTIIRMLL
ncbi:Cell wall / vacuolar inhibitor of fructosidase 1 [Camellia lanceoleosa]|uniref:Cell wall / vacuolar inhibitor of fructosidase 1 n=1 Tax=Camellia lanceoleosa TaxID=1840588 RepID=A0ACC0HC92_9ERIC|nr:Cell wall / vacuolar inhibitor of fructosidase 1 [Camellia lanceoleosa]